MVALLTTLLGLPALAFLLIISPAPAEAQHRILYVAPAGACVAFAPDCFATVQAAVDAANPGDEIRVAAGVYTDLHVRPRADTTGVGVVTQTVYISKTVTLRGGYNAAFSAWNPTAYVTGLDAGGRGRGLYIVGNIAPTIEGLHITGGNAAGMQGYNYFGDFDAGGGVYVLTATAALLHNTIFSNVSPFVGGGVFFGKSAGRLEDNIIAQNTADSGGGGVTLFDAPALLYRNAISLNVSNNIGGGLWLFGSDAQISHNSIVNNTTLGVGGGVDVASCNPAFVANVIVGNQARFGGGGYFWYSRSDLINNVIANNSAGTAGAGIWAAGSRLRLLHTTLARNGGAAVALGDRGGGRSTLAMTNTLMSDNPVGVGVDLSVANSAVTIAGVLWHNTPITVTSAGVVTVTAQFQGDPAFAPDAYHLTAGSAAINRGLPAGVLQDIDDQRRFLGAPDLGADEYWPAGQPRSFLLPLIVR
jgi:hypothetical protein